MIHPEPLCAPQREYYTTPETETRYFVNAITINLLYNIQIRSRVEYRTLIEQNRFSYNTITV